MYATLHTAAPGRVGRGRIYVSGLGQSLLNTADTALWQDATVAAWDGYLSDFNTGLNTEGATWCVNSRHTSTAEPITSALCHAMVGCQRDRRFN